MYLNVFAAQQAITRAREIRETQLAEVRAAYRAEASATVNDPNLSPEGVNNRRAELRQTARTRAAARLDQLEADFDRSISTIHKTAEAALAPPTDPATAMLSEQRQARAWDRSRRLLESGRTIPAVIAAAPDPDTVHALRAELPTWVTTQSSPDHLAVLGGGEADSHDFRPLLRTLDVRLAEIIEGQQGIALRVRLEADAIEQGTRLMFRGIRQELTGHGSGLGNSVEVHYADQAARRTLTPARSEGE